MTDNSKLDSTCRDQNGHPAARRIQFQQIKREARQIIQTRLAYLTRTPEMTHRIVTKREGASHQRKSYGDHFLGRAVAYCYSRP